MFLKALRDDDPEDGSAGGSEESEAPIESAIRCAIDLLCDKIISSDSDLVGVCFFNTSDHENPMDLPGVHIFQELDVPDARRILQLEELQRE